jgi:hypothetical protein
MMVYAYMAETRIGAKKMSRTGAAVATEGLLHDCESCWRRPELGLGLGPRVR